MEHQAFKKEAKRLGRLVYKVRTKKNSYGEWKEITYASILNETTISIQQTRKFFEMSYDDILTEWSN